MTRANQFMWVPVTLWPLSSIHYSFGIAPFSGAVSCAKTISEFSHPSYGLPGESHVKLSACNGDSIPGSGRFPGGGHSNPPHYSCLEIPMNRGAWWATVPGVTKSQTRLSSWAHSTGEAFHSWNPTIPKAVLSVPTNQVPCTFLSACLGSKTVCPSLFSLFKEHMSLLILSLFQRPYSPVSLSLFSTHLALDLWDAVIRVCLILELFA